MHFLHQLQLVNTIILLTENCIIHLIKPRNNEKDKGLKSERTFLLSGICLILLHTAKEPANVLKKNLTGGNEDFMNFKYFE